MISTFWSRRFNVDLLCGSTQYRVLTITELLTYNLTFDSYIDCISEPEEAIYYHLKNILRYMLPYYEVDRILCPIFPMPGCPEPRYDDKDDNDCDDHIRIDPSDHQSVIPHGVVCRTIQDLQKGEDGDEIANILIGVMHRRFFDPSVSDVEPYDYCVVLNILSEGRRVQEVLNIFEEASTNSPEVSRNIDRIQNVFACTFYNSDDDKPAKPDFRQTNFHHLIHVISDIFGTVAGGGEPDMEQEHLVYRYLDSVYTHADRDCDMDDMSGIPEPRMTPPPFLTPTGKPDDNKNYSSTEEPKYTESPTKDPTTEYATRDQNTTYPHTSYPTRDPYPTGDPYYTRDAYPTGDPYYTRDPYPTGDPYYTRDPYPTGDPSYYTRDPYPTGDPYYTGDPYSTGDPYYTRYPTYGPEPPPPSICKIRHQFVRTTVAFMKELQCR